MARNDEITFLFLVLALVAGDHGSCSLACVSPEHEPLQHDDDDYRRAADQQIGL